LSDSEINSYLKNRSLGCPITNLNEMEKIKHNIYWHHRFTYYTEKIGNQLYFANKYKVPKYQLEGKALRRKPLRFQ
jgi:hypothetical protein